MKPGTRVKTPDGKGTVIKPIGKAPKNEPVLVSLDEMVRLHNNWYYSESELKIIK